MADIPSTVMKALGISLVLIGITGVFGGIYALKLVHEYDIVNISPDNVTNSITEIRLELEKKTLEIDNTFDDIGSSMEDSSNSIGKVGVKFYESSSDIKTVSNNMSNAAENLQLASDLNKDTAIYLTSAADGLKSWANNYESNGSPLPSKSDFINSVDKITTAGNKITSTGEKLSETSENINETSLSLMRTSSGFNETSIELTRLGESLNGTKKNFLSMKVPIGLFISSLSIAMEESSDTIRALVGITNNLKTGAYLLIGYLIIFHIIVLGLGIALIIIDVNLFYSSRSE